jgi:hypothetical protein
LSNVPADRALGVAAVEVVSPELALGHPGAHDVARDFANQMPWATPWLTVPDFR